MGSALPLGDPAPLDGALPPAELAVAFVASRPFVGSTIVGATTLAQLEANLKACARKLDPEVVAEIDALHLKFTNPAP